MNETIISVGGRIIVDGNLCEIVEICGMTVTLRGPDQRLSVRTTRDLVRSSPLLPEESPCIEPDPIGHLMSALTPLQRERLIQTVRDVREVLTGYPDDQPALDQLPRPEYSASKRLGERQAAKAAERGVSARAVRRWCDSYTLSGPIGLVDRRLLKGQAPLRGIDPRWISSCLEVVEAHTFASRPTQQLLLERIEKHVVDTYGADVVAIPKREKARHAVKELTRGTNALTGSTKTKRSVANRPSGPYGRLRPTRPGEYVLLDTTPLDVFAMDPVTLKWVGLELTIALDLYTRTVPGLSLTPVSTKSTDAAAVLYDTMGCPDPQHPLASFEGLQEVPGAGMPVSSSSADLR